MGGHIKIISGGMMEIGNFTMYDTGRRVMMRLPRVSEMDVTRYDLDENGGLSVCYVKKDGGTDEDRKNDLRQMRKTD